MNNVSLMTVSPSTDDTVDGSNNLNMSAKGIYLGGSRPYI